MRSMPASSCLYCGESTVVSSSWTTLFSASPLPKLCNDCEALLQPITGSVCPICSRPRHEETICADCLRWEKEPRWKGQLERNYSLYEYNDQMKDVIARWKYRGDAVLGYAFYNQIRAVYLTHCYLAIPVPIPLSRERIEERGFNQSEMIASFVEDPLSFQEKIHTRFAYTNPPSQLKHVLVRTTHEEKQSKKSRQERITSATQPFQFNPEKSIIKGENIVLFDDIYTTGSTLRKAAEILHINGAEKIYSITLARG